MKSTFANPKTHSEQSSTVHASKVAAGVLALVVAMAAACGGQTDSNPFAGTDSGAGGGGGGAGGGGGGGAGGGGGGGAGGGGGGGAGGGGGGAGGGGGGGSTTTDGGTQTGGGVGCGMTPTRYIVLGHSVAACYQVGGPTSETCSLKNTETYMATKFPGLAYENYAVNGALIADVVNTQLPKVQGSAGNVFVNLFIGGNDLAAHLYETDTMAQQSWANLKPKATSDMDKILSYFDDATKFPGKAVVLVNSQYNPFDECVTASNSFATTVKQGLIKEFNTLLQTVAAGHKTSVVIDQYAAVLGHGDNYNQANSNGNPATPCPYYASGNPSWMADLIHPNTAGHVSLSKQMTAGVDSIFKCP